MKGKNTKLGEYQSLYSKGGVCNKCQKPYPSLTVEHIIPVNILVNLGLADLAYSDTENYEPLCMGCNRLKGGQLDPLHPKTHQLLLKYVELSRIKYC